MCLPFVNVNAQLCVSISFLRSTTDKLAFAQFTFFSACFRCSKYTIFFFPYLLSPHFMKLKINTPSDKTEIKH